MTYYRCNDDIFFSFFFVMNVVFFTLIRFLQGYEDISICDDWCIRLACLVSKLKVMYILSIYITWYFVHLNELLIGQFRTVAYRNFSISVQFQYCSHKQCKRFLLLVYLKIWNKNYWNFCFDKSNEHQLTMVLWMKNITIIKDKHILKGLDTFT